MGYNRIRVWRKIETVISSCNFKGTTKTGPSAYLSFTLSTIFFSVTILHSPDNSSNVSYLS